MPFGYCALPGLARPEPFQEARGDDIANRDENQGGPQDGHQIDGDKRLFHGHEPEPRAEEHHGAREQRHDDDAAAPFNRRRLVCCRFDHRGAWLAKVLSHDVTILPRNPAPRRVQ
jgi:hypothetical protein